MICRMKKIKMPPPMQDGTVKYVMLVFMSVLVLVESLLFNNFQEEEIKRVARLVMNCGQIPGMSIAVVKESERWVQPMGVTNLTSQEEVKESTNFVIASLTKAFTSTLLLMLLKESKEGYTIDTPIKDILKQDDLFPDTERSKGTTIKDILSHRVGLARADLALFAGYPDDFSLQNVSSALSCLPVQAPFRDGFIYSNFMYSLAGHVIERLSNQSYADVLRDRILEPLGMSSTLTRYNFSDPNHSMARPYMFADGKVVPVHHTLFQLPVFLPALGLATNARDMVQWLQTLLELGESPSGRQVIPSELIAMTQYPVTPCIINQLRPRFPQPELTFAYGMGWFQSTYKGFRRMWHAGTLYGFTSVTWLFPDMKIAVFATTNGPARTQDTKNQIKTLLSYIIDPLLGYPSWVDQSKACIYSTFLNQQTPINSRSSLSDKRLTDNISCDKFNHKYNHTNDELEKYIGSYYNKLFGKVNVQLIESASILNETNLYKKCPHHRSHPDKILQVTFGVRFSGILHATANKNLFQMEPTGIFEFSAHPQEDRDATMPVEFLMVDGTDSVAHMVKAVWEAVEVIHYSRYLSQEVCFEEAPMSGGAVKVQSNIFSNQLMIYSVFMHVLYHIVNSRS